MKSILAPIDFSTASRASGEYAAALAKEMNAGLVLLHVYMEPIVLGELPPEELTTGQELFKENQDAVNQEVNYLSEKYNIPVQGEARMGYVIETIISTSKERQTDMIVMGMKGAGKAKRFFGSTTVSMLRKAASPLLVIPEAATYTSIKQICLAADFQYETNISCLVFLEDILRTYKASIQVLNIQKKTQPEATEMAGKLSLNNMLSGFNPAWFEVEDKDTEHGIMQFISSHPTDLLVLIAHHHNFFERLFGKEHAPSIAYHSPIPMLILQDIQR